MFGISKAVSLLVCLTVGTIPSGLVAQTTTEVAASSETEKQIPSGNLAYPFNAEKIDAVSALRYFSRNIGVGLNIEEGFEPSEPVNVASDLTRQEYLSNLASLFDFVWYFDGSILFVSPVGTVETQVFSLQSTTGPELIALLETLGVMQPKFKHRADETRQALLVSGPKSYLDVVAKVVEAVEAAESQKVKVLRGASGNSVTRLAQQNQSPLETSPSPNTSE